MGGAGFEPTTSPHQYFWAYPDSNGKPLRCKRSALPLSYMPIIGGGALTSELTAQIFFIKYRTRLSQERVGKRQLHRIPSEVKLSEGEDEAIA